MPLIYLKGQGQIMNTFTLNGNTITAKKFDFNLLCDLDQYGISITDAGTKPMSLVRAYIALCAGVSLIDAGNLIQEHMANGGTIDDIVEVMNKEIEASDFFRNPQQKTNPKKTTKAQGTTK